MTDIERLEKSLNTKIENYRTLTSQILDNPDLTVEAKQRKTSEIREDARKEAMKSAKAMRYLATKQITDLEKSEADAWRTHNEGFDYAELALRADELKGQLSGDMNTIDGDNPVKAAVALRERMALADDQAGLRALRIATSGLIPEWRRHEGLRGQATALAETMKADATPPEVAKIQSDIDQAKGNLIRIDHEIAKAGRVFESDGGRAAMSTGTHTAFAAEVVGIGQGPFDASYARASGGGVVTPDPSLVGD